MKILKKAIKLSYARFSPNIYQRRYHFAIAFDNNKPKIRQHLSPLCFRSFFAIDMNPHSHSFASFIECFHIYWYSIVNRY